MKPRNALIAVEVSLGALVIGALIAFPMFFGRWRIPQGGMFPTYAAGAHIVARKSPYKSIADVRRGDIVIYKHFRDGVRYDLIWRVVGLPGEHIAIHRDRVQVNGRTLPHRPLRQQDGFSIVEETGAGRSYEIALSPDTKGMSELAEIEVPPGHLFVLGDDRHGAADSRDSGPVPFEAIIARPIW